MQTSLLNFDFREMFYIVEQRQVAYTIFSFCVFQSLNPSTLSSHRRADIYDEGYSAEVGVRHSSGSQVNYNITY